MSIKQNVSRAKSDYDNVYVVGIEKGYSEGKTEGIEQGKTTQYDEFWDAYQQNGRRTAYSFAFAGAGWTAEMFKPKYALILTAARSMFAGSLKGLDLEQHLSNLGITFDTSGVTSSDGFDYFLEYTSPSVLPTIDVTGVSVVRRLFFYTVDLVTVRKLVLKSDGSQTFNTAFPGCTNLKDIVIEGTIGGNGLNLQWSTNLTHDSLMSIINALSTITSGLSVTLSKTAVNNAFETSEGAADGSTSEEWLALISTKNNWTISLVE